MLVETAHVSLYLASVCLDLAFHNTCQCAKRACQASSPPGLSFEHFIFESVTHFCELVRAKTLWCWLRVFALRSSQIRTFLLFLHLPIRWVAWSLLEWTNETFSQWSPEFSLEKAKVMDKWKQLSSAPCWSRWVEETHTHRPLLTNVQSIQCSCQVKEHCVLLLHLFLRVHASVNFRPMRRK